MTFTRLPFTSRPLWLLSGLAMVLSACGQLGEEAPTDSYDMTGSWQFQVPVGDNVTNGSLSLSLNETVYSGTLTTNQGNNILEVQSVRLQGRDIVMTVKSLEGDVVFKGSLDRSSDRFSGTVTYHNGQVFPMQGNRPRIVGGEN